MHLFWYHSLPRLGEYLVHPKIQSFSFNHFLESWIVLLRYSFLIYQMDQNQYLRSPLKVDVWTNQRPNLPYLCSDWSKLQEKTESYDVLDFPPTYWLSSLCRCTDYKRQECRNKWVYFCNSRRTKRSLRAGRLFWDKISRKVLSTSF